MEIENFSFSKTVKITFSQILRFELKKKIIFLHKILLQWEILTIRRINNVTIRLINSGRVNLIAKECFVTKAIPFPFHKARNLLFEATGTDAKL